MLGFRLNKLGAAMRSGLDLRSLYGGGASGFLPKLDNADYDRQTFNAPATNAASAGDPIGLWLPSQSPADVTNQIIWTDHLDNSTWVKAGGVATVTANVMNAPSVVRGGAPIVDMITDPGEVGAYQNLTATVGVTVCHSRYVYAGTATSVRFRDDTGAGRDVIFNISAGTVGTITGSLLNQGIENIGGGWYRIFIAYTTDATTIRHWVRTTSAGTFYSCGAQTEFGVTTPSAYQPNAGSLGGSNRRAGGSNMLLWANEYSNGSAFWTLNNVTNSEKTGTAASGQKIDVITGAAGSSLKLLRPTSNVTIVAGGTYSVQFKVQYSTHRYLSLTFDDAATANGCWTAFDLLNGTVSRAAVAYGTGTAVTSTITSLGGNDYLITLTGTAGSSATGARIALSLQDSGTTQFNNSSSTGSLGVWDAGMNIGSLATYSRNMDQLGGLLLSAPLFQSTSANRGTLARRPSSGIRNLFEYSEDWTNAYWSKAAILSQTAGAFVPTTANAEHYMRRTVTVPASSAFVIRARVSTGSGYTSLRLRILNAAATGNGFFGSVDASTGATAGGIIGIGTFASAAATLVSAGVYDLVVSGTVGASTTSVIADFFALPTNETSASTFAGNGTSGISVTNVQVAVAAGAYQKVTSAADITESGQPDVWHTLWDGTSDFGTFGVQSFGSASLFADAGQAWTVWGVFRALSATGTLIGKAGTTSANRTLLVRLTSTSLRCQVRGTTNDLTTSVIDGAFHVWALRWDGSTLRLYFDNQASTTLSVGSAAQESQDITVAANNSAAPENYQAAHNDVAMIDRALSDAEVAQLMSNLNATYRAGL